MDDPVVRFHLVGHAKAFGGFGSLAHGHKDLGRAEFFWNGEIFPKGGGVHPVAGKDSADGSIKVGVLGAEVGGFAAGGVEFEVVHRADEVVFGGFGKAEESGFGGASAFTSAGSAAPAFGASAGGTLAKGGGGGGEFRGGGRGEGGGGGGGGEGKDIGGVLDFGGGGFSHGGGRIFGGCIFGRGRGGGFGAGVGRVDVFAGEDGERISAFEDDDATEAEQGQDVDGDGDEDGGRGKKGGEDEPLFFLTFGVGGRSGARGADGGCGVGRHGAKNSLLLFGGKSERDSGAGIFDREKREK